MIKPKKYYIHFVLTDDCIPKPLGKRLIIKNINNIWFNNIDSGIKISKLRVRPLKLSK